MTAAGNSKLSGCAALVFSPNGPNTEALLELCNTLGFAQAVRDTEIAQITAGRIVFFIIHGALSDAQKLHLLQAIRATSSPLRRYAPVVCLVPSGPRHQLVPLIEMGFDEVLFLSDSIAEMAAKLSGQLNRPQVYVQTDKYFGPDRRRIELVNRADPRRRHRKDDCRKIQVMRDPEKGIQATEVF